ncbi:MAG: efflux RND transporter periplasmic adaptor subunit, partial [Myxococcota bacterium]
IQAGAAAQFSVDALGTEMFDGVVDRIGVVADSAARTFDVEVAVKNPGNRLKPGMLARVRLPRRSIENVVVIRRDAVVEDLDGPTVFLASAGKAERRPVKLGPVDGDRVAIVEGLEEGEPLIVIGQRMLVEGEPIKVVGKEDTLKESVAKAEE